MPRKKVLVVCMVDSIHVARWLQQFLDQKIDFVLFPSGPNRRIHPQIERLLANTNPHEASFDLIPFRGMLSVPLWALDRLLDESLRGWLLRRAINRIKPDHLHAIEFQHAGYIVERAFRSTQLDAELIVTNYGSDIFWFQRFPKHRQKIVRLLSLADKYSAECQRDVQLAHALGYTGEVVAIFPNAGPVEVPDEVLMTLSPPSQRKTIAMKGYQGWVGRASLALDALLQLEGQLDGFSVELFSTNQALVRRAKTTAKALGIELLIHPKNSLTHRQVIEILARSRVYMGLSLSDGASTSFLEAMAVGAFPIQTSSSCAEEWVTDGDTAFLIEDLNAGQIANRLRDALSNDGLVDTAAIKNQMRISVQASKAASDQLMKSFYE